MHNEEVVWSILNHSFCSFKAKTINQNFCRNKYNVTGICNHTMCPLANGNYATILEEDGVLYLYSKVIERAHSPLNLWERTKLSQSFSESIQQIEKELQYWNPVLVKRIKQRLTKITQYLIRLRRMARKPQPKLVRINKKVERRERIREAKAEKAANLEKAIEKELVDRLKDGVYEGIYNFPTEQYEEALGELELEEEEPEREKAAELDIEDIADDGNRFMERYELPEPRDDTEPADLLPIADIEAKESRKRKRRGPKPALELEEELEEVQERTKRNVYEKE